MHKRPANLIAAPRPELEPELTLAAQAELLAALQARLQALLSAAQPGALVQRFETHSAVVLLAGARAWKFKKAVNLGFLDFSTLARRQHCCVEELRLNRRLAPALYLALRPVLGPPESPWLSGVDELAFSAPGRAAAQPARVGDGAAASARLPQATGWPAGEVLDWAVEMRAFEQAGLWAYLLAAGALRPQQVSGLADQLARFHAQAAQAPAGGWLGSPAQVRAPMQDCLRDLAVLLHEPADQAAVARLRAWEAQAFERIAPLLAARQAAGRVREAHGDLHLGNVAEIDGQTTVFDGIEFNDEFRWIDVLSDIAFMVMDLLRHGRKDLAFRFLNRYLEQTGDYAGLPLLRYFLVYRALVRAKVGALRAGQCTEPGEAAPILAAARGDLRCALACSEPAPRCLLATHGVSGSGKSTLSQGLLEAGGLIRLRADVERKRLFGLAPLERGAERPELPLYTRAATDATHAAMLEASGAALAGGFGVVLDATFMRRAPRDQARLWAQAQGCRFVLLSLQTDEATLRERVMQRRARGDDASDADLAVLAEQLAALTPLEPDELADVLVCDQAASDGTGQDGAAVWARLTA